MPSHEYLLPTNNKKDITSISLQDFINTLNGTNLCTSLVSTFTGISKSFVKNCLSTLNIDEVNYNNDDLSCLYNYINNLLNNLCNTSTSCTFDESINDYIIINKPSDSELQTNFFLDDFYSNKENVELLNNYKRNEDSGDYKIENNHLPLQY